MSLQQSLIQFKKCSHLQISPSDFCVLLSRDCREKNACDAGADRRSRARGPMSLYVVICCNQNSIQFFGVRVCLSQLRYVAVQLDLHRFLVIGTGQCSSWCCCGMYSCLQLTCQETEFLGEACFACSGVKQVMCLLECSSKKFLILIHIFVL